jgi:hypothetical protein
MHKICIGLAFTAVIAMPASAQDYRKNFASCAKEIGLNPDVSYTHRQQPDAGGRVMRRYRANGQAQQTAFHDCLARKASLAGKPSAK